MENNEKQILAARKNKVIYRQGDTVVKLFDEGYSKPDILNESIESGKGGGHRPEYPQGAGGNQNRRQMGDNFEYISGKTLQSLMGKTG